MTVSILIMLIARPMQRGPSEWRATGSWLRDQILVYEAIVITAILVGVWRKDSTLVGFGFLSGICCAVLWLMT